ncbi:hypothetical protein GJ700_12575 [Duganella sp. FT92W]|uniref:Replication protein n=1 Tax=Pseudoduganella rivuli TaxID=2666085 RepID=A0A7X2IMG1_9BURK|nr:hypothetical protein [Pseudoduganella rivuli]MRV72544.1 hypothetical protein [Pseudoduganella rivuli]
MAGEWIKVRTNLWNDPRISQLCDLTEVTKPAVIGALYWLWASADEHTQDGYMPGLSVKAIDRETGIAGFGAALVSIDWILDTPGGITLIRFEEHNGASAKSRAQTARRVANHKSGGKVTLDSDDGNAPSVTEALPERYPAVSTALPREEKNKELLKPLSSDDDVRKCPVGTLVDLYHELMPLNPRVKVVGDDRKRAIRARWREAAGLSCKPFGYRTKAEGLAAWRQFFEVCAESNFLTGKAPATPGKAPFIADIDFLFSPGGFAKTLENKYHRDAA